MGGGSILPTAGSSSMVFLLIMAVLAVLKLLPTGFVQF